MSDPGLGDQLLGLLTGAARTGYPTPARVRLRHLVLAVNQPQETVRAALDDLGDQVAWHAWAEDAWLSLSARAFTVAVLTDPDLPGHLARSPWAAARPREATLVLAGYAAEYLEVALGLDPCRSVRLLLAARSGRGYADPDLDAPVAAWAARGRLAEVARLLEATRVPDGVPLPRVLALLEAVLA